MGTMLKPESDSHVPDKQTVEARIIKSVSCHPGCLLEELALECPDLTMTQVILTVDRLSRTDQLQLERKGPGVFTVRVATP